MNSLRSVLHELSGNILLVGSVLIFIGQIYACLLAFRMYYVNRKNGILRPVVYLLWVLFGMVLLILFLDGRHYAVYTDMERDWVPIVAFIYQQPWVLIAVCEVVLALATGFSIQMVIHYYKQNVTPIVIKEAVDLLPVGICYGNAKRRPVFSNLMINDFCLAAFKESLTDTGRFQERLEEAGEERDGRYLLEWEDRDYLFGIQNATVKGQRYEQIFASDVTEATRITKELKEKNARLLDMQLRMKAFAVESGDFAMEQELLNARRAVHDNLGYTLARGAYYMKREDSSDAPGVLALLKSVNDTLLYEAERPEELYQPVDDAIRLASGIGIRVEIKGPLPESEELRELLGQAIRECAANTFKHAQGDMLSVTVTALSGIRIEIENNGKAPEEEIRPAGGLLSLQKNIALMGGNMSIESAPAFKLKMEFSKISPK